MNDALRDAPFRGALEDEFLVEPGQLVQGGKSVAELHDLRIKEWEAPLDRMRHEHPVPLRGDQVAREERDDLEVLRAGE